MFRPASTKIVEISATLDNPNDAQKLAQHLAEQSVALNRKLDNESRKISWSKRGGHWSMPKTGFERRNGTETGSSRQKALRYFRTRSRIRTRCGSASRRNSGRRARHWPTQRPTRKLPRRGKQITGGANAVHRAGSGRHACPRGQPRSAGFDADKKVGRRGHGTGKAEGSAESHSITNYVWRARMTNWRPTSLPMCSLLPHIVPNVWRSWTPE